MSEQGDGRARSLRVQVPATTANIGPGFDCIGAALQRSNVFTFIEAPDWQITVSGVEAGKVAGTASENLVYRAFNYLWEHAMREPRPSAHLTIDLSVPLARGLGSSATAIIGGMVAANQFSSSQVSNKVLLSHAIAFEGHPDNVVPALLGNCRLSLQKDNEWLFTDIPWSKNIVPVIAVPDFELSTAAAREVLPSSYSLADGVFNIGRMGVLVNALAAADPQGIAWGLQDRVHVPYRQTLIHGYESVSVAAKSAGAWGVTISGAGPTLLALGPEEQAPRIAIAMKQTWAEMGVQAEVTPTNIDPRGTRWEWIDVPA
ncbi:MAG: homoserine kinase [Cyanobacteria bacterium P01_H01_bin.15]